MSVERGNLIFDSKNIKKLMVCVTQSPACGRHLLPSSGVNDTFWLSKPRFVASLEELCPLLVGTASH